MKRTILTFLSLVLAGSLAFAETTPAPAPVGEIHFSVTGIFLPAYAIDSKDVVSGWGMNWADNGPGTYNDFKITYTSAGKDFGFYLDDKFSQDQISTTLNDIAAWYKFNPMLKLTLGKINCGEYSEFSQIAGDQLESKFFNQEFGSLVQVSPVEPLSIGFAYYVPGSNTSVDSSGAIKANTSTSFVDNFGLAVSYKIGDAGLVHAFYKAAGGNVTGGDNFKLFDVGGNYAPAKEWFFSAAYEYDFSTIAGASKANSINGIYVGAKYTGLTNIVVTVDYHVNTGKKADADTKTYNYIEAAVEYDFANIPLAVGLQGGYDSGMANTYKWKGNGLLGGSDDFASVVGGAEIYPYVQYNFSSANVRAGFLYLTGGIDIPTGGTTKPAWAVPITYNLSF